MTGAGKLAGKVALVTGGTSGIGEAIVRRFREEGARVATLAHGAIESCTDDLLVMAGDVRDTAANRMMVERTLQQFGRLDIFVGNAGVYDNRLPFADYDEDGLSCGFDELFGINVKGYALGARAALAELRKTSGVILFTGSVSGVAAGFGGALYIAAKHAVNGLTKQLAYELAPLGVRVNCVAPGYAATAMSGLTSLGQGKTTSAPTAAKLPLGEFATVDDYAEAYILLASDAGRRMATGSVLVLDGGTAQTGPGPRAVIPAFEVEERR